MTAQAWLCGGLAVALCACGGLSLRLHAATTERDAARSSAAAWESIATASCAALEALRDREKRLHAALTEREDTLAALRADAASGKKALKEALTHDKTTADWGAGAVPAVLDGVFRAAGGVRAGGAGTAGAGRADP